MNVYDFDGTIYNGDSSAEFFLFCLKRHPVLLLNLPRQLISFLLYALKFIDKTQLKEGFFSFLQKIDSYENEVQDFWETHDNNIFNWYIEQKKVNDVVITASPRFLIQPICQRLHIANLIASEVNPKTGKFHGKNCHDVEKVCCFRKQFPNSVIDKFYSDSDSDAPLAKIARTAYKVGKEGKISRWM